VKEVVSNHVVRKEVMKTFLVIRKRHAEQVFSDHGDRKRGGKKVFSFVVTLIGRR
jgi:hypothetical protein